METGGGGWGLRCTQRREDGAVTGCQPLPGRGALSQGQPLPGYLFIGDRRRGALPGWGSTSSPPPSLSGYSTSSFCLCHRDGTGRRAEGPGVGRAEGEGSHGGGLGPVGAPRAPFCLPLQMMGVNSSEGQLGRWVGAPGGPLLPRPHLPWGSIVLINTGSGIRLWLSPWQRREDGVQPTPKFCLFCPLP